MGLELWYKGSIRKFMGSGMGFANFDGTIPLDTINQRNKTAVEGLYIVVNEVLKDSISISVLYYDKVDKYKIEMNQELKYSYFGNAFGFDLEFYLK